MQVVIYAITRIGTAEEYIGSSISLRARWKEHRYSLRRNKHHCVALQKAWNEYGESAFAFSVIEEQTCETIGDRAALEIQWIRRRGFYNGLTHFIPAESITPRSEAQKILQSATNKAKMASDPEYREFLKGRGEAMKAYMKSPEGRAMMSEQSKRRWQDPEERKRLRAGLDRVQSDPEHWERHAEKIKAAHGTPEMREMHRANTKALWETAEYRDKVSKKAAANRWGDPEAKARQAEKMRAYHASHRAKLSAS